MKILAFAGSTSRQSINKALATYAATVYKKQFQPDAVVEVLDLNDYELPLYSVDREQADGIPDAAQDFFDKIGAADQLIVSYAEHNGSYSAAWKNIFDWMSRINQGVFQNKPMLALATSPGAAGASNVLKVATDSAAFFAANLKGSLSIPSFQDNFDYQTKTLSNTELAQALHHVLEALHQA